MDSLELLALDMDAAFTYDTRGRMLQTNEPCESARRPASRLFVGRTLAGRSLARFGSSLSDDLAVRLAPLLKPELDATAIRALLGADEEAGPTYYFPETLLPPTEAVPLTAENRHLARRTFRWLHDEIPYWQPCFAIVHEGAAVSVCYSSRITARACAAGVDTLLDYRGHGFATAVTLAWGAAVRDSGRIPFYGTSWNNEASRGVARRAGLVEYAWTSTWD